MPPSRPGCPLFLITAALQVKCIRRKYRLNPLRVLQCLHNTHSLGKVPSVRGQQRGYS